MLPFLSYWTEIISYGEEVSEEAIDSKYFVGYGFKKSLLVVQQAIMVYCMTH